MTQPTIEQLISELERCAGDYRWNPPQFRADETTAKPLNLARSALQSRIAEVEKERDDWHKMADKMSVRIWEYGLCEAYAALTARYAHPSQIKR